MLASTTVDGLGVTRGKSDVLARLHARYPTCCTFGVQQRAGGLRRAARDLHGR